MDTFQRFLGQQVIKVSVLGGCWSPDYWCKDWQARLHYISKCEGNVLEQLASGLSGRWFPVMENFQKSSGGSVLLSQSGLLGLWFSMQENKEDSLWHSCSWLSIGPLWRHIQRSPISPFLTAYLSNVLSTWCVPAAMIIAHSSMSFVIRSPALFNRKPVFYLVFIYLFGYYVFPQGKGDVRGCVPGTSRWCYWGFRTNFSTLPFLPPSQCNKAWRATW